MESTSVLLNNLVSEMATQKGYAYTTGYLQSMLMEVSYGLRSKSLQETLRKDIESKIKSLKEGSFL